MSLSLHSTAAANYFFSFFLSCLCHGGGGMKCLDTMHSAITDFCVASSEDRGTWPSHYTRCESLWKFLHYLSALAIGLNGKEAQKELISLCTQSL